MKKLLIAAACLLTPATASAEHWDVIAFEMTGKCSFEKYLGVVADFNAWGADHGYQAKVAQPLQSDNLTTYFWVGTTADAATYGAAWDAWRDALADKNSTPSKLWVRFQECSTNMQRTGYDVY
jgi:hypothetical protein